MAHGRRIGRRICWFDWGFLCDYCFLDVVVRSSMARGPAASDTHALNKARQFGVVLIQPPRDVVASEKNREANLCRSCRVRRQTDTDATGGGGNHQVANEYFLWPFGSGLDQGRRRDHL